VKKPATVRFTEEMHGAVGFGAATYREGWDEGIASTCPFMFHLTISVDDLDRFADDPDHTAPAVGWVRCPPLSAANMLVERGEFNLFAPGLADGRLTMRYRLWFRDGAGNPLTMNGFKDVGDDPGFDVWKDTTSLFINLLTGHVEEPPRAADGRPVPDDPELIRARGDPRDPDPRLRSPTHHLPRHRRRRLAIRWMFMAALWRTYRGRGK
jgi:cholesterol oxidase